MNRHVKRRRGNGSPGVEAMQAGVLRPGRERAAREGSCRRHRTCSSALLTPGPDYGEDVKAGQQAQKPRPRARRDSGTYSPIGALSSVGLVLGARIGMDRIPPREGGGGRSIDGNRRLGGARLADLEENADRGQRRPRRVRPRMPLRSLWLSVSSTKASPRLMRVERRYRSPAGPARTRARHRPAGWGSARPGWWKRRYRSPTGQPGPPGALR